MVEAVTQGTCTGCDSNDDNYKVRDRQHDVPAKDDDADNATIYRKVQCECGEFAEVIIGPDGLTTSGSISHDDASWNQSESSSD